MMSRFNGEGVNDFVTVALRYFSLEFTHSNGFLFLFQAPGRLDANRYATKKTIAQGMLDVALLTANASQLKYVMQVKILRHT